MPVITFVIFDKSLHYIWSFHGGILFSLNFYKQWVFFVELIIKALYIHILTSTSSSYYVYYLSWNSVYPGFFTLLFRVYPVLLQMNNFGIGIVDCLDKNLWGNFTEGLLWLQSFNWILLWLWDSTFKRSKLLYLCLKLIGISVNI